MALAFSHQAAVAATLDFAAPPGGNYDKAEFRLWYPTMPARFARS